MLKRTVLDSRPCKCSCRSVRRKIQTRTLHVSPPRHSTNDSGSDGSRRSKDGVDEGAMSRRLAEMTDEALQSGSKSAQKAIHESGFSEDLKRQLEDRIASASFRTANPQAFAQAELPSSAGAGTSALAGAQPWTGAESVADATLRMLNDAHKPLRSPPRSASSVRLPARIDTGRPPPKAASSGARLANARDKTSAYSFLKDPRLPESQREQIRRELKERLAPAARGPATLTGLASLANERIEDAIARGQFANLPRGRRIERDHNATSPFLDTTEYLLNKIIQRQDIVPPWIEKQQELLAAAARFRARLRSDWRRHVARLIASRGGSVESQTALADAYARAEAAENPAPMAADAPATPDPPPSVGPFRDETWLRTERAYHTLAVADLNSIARSYNLMAPELARKPYYSLERELRACDADVAPRVAGEIRERARVPAERREQGGGREGAGVLERLGGGGAARVYDERRPKYGLREFWRDLFAKDG